MSKAAEIRAASYAEILAAPNAGELLSAYEAECSLPQIGPISPQADMYAAMERSGAFQCFGAFETGQLAGFGTALTYIVPHYGRRIATVESLFMRRGRNGRALMDALEGYGEEHACEAILYSARTMSRFERLLLLSKGYERTHSVFMRCLRRPPG